MADLGVLDTKKSLATAPAVVLTLPALGTPGLFARSVKSRGPLPTWAALPADALQLPVNGMIYGTLKIAGVAAPDRQLRCYHRATGNKVIGCAISDQAGNYKFSGLTPGEKYYVVAVDFPVGGAYDAVIQDNVIAEIDQFAGAAAASASASGSLLVAPPTIALLHFDGADGSTTIVDEVGHVVTAVGNAQISTAQSKWGGSSLKLDGAGDYLTLADSPDWDFGTGDFTIEAWIYMTNWAASESDSYDACICSRDVFPDRGFRFGLNGYTTSYSQLRFYGYTLNGGSYKMSLANYSFALNTWYHVAVCRKTGVGYLFINGVLSTAAGWTDLNIDIGNSSLPIRVGAANYSTTDNDYFPGHIEELRVAKVALYTASFTPPTAPYTL